MSAYAAPTGSARANAPACASPPATCCLWRWRECVKDKVLSIGLIRRRFNKRVPWLRQLHILLGIVLGIQRVPKITVRTRRQCLDAIVRSMVLRYFTKRHKIPPRGVIRHRFPAFSLYQCNKVVLARLKILRVHYHKPLWRCQRHLLWFRVHLYFHYTE